MMVGDFNSALINQLSLLRDVVIGNVCNFLSDLFEELLLFSFRGLLTVASSLTWGDTMLYLVHW